MRARSTQHRRGSLVARGLSALAITAGLLVTAAAPALAAQPVDLDGAYVIDDTGVLGASGEARVQQSLDALFDATGAPLFVVVVGSFEGALDAEAWADESALRSGLGDGDALLAIAVDDREYATSVGQSFPASDAELAAAESDALIPALRDDRWADGIVAYAEALQGGVEQAASAGGIPVVPIVIGAGVVGVGAWFFWRSRRKKSPVTADVAQQSIGELDQSASRRLVQLDDALTTSEQELGFAEAQFGSETTAGFRAALEQARELVAGAFRARRELDDENPETDEQRRAALLGIIESCEQADDLLEQQEEAFEALRDVESDLPAALAAAQQQRASAPARVTAAATTIGRLASEYSAAALRTISETPTQAGRLLELAEAELTEASDRQAAGATSEAAVDVRSAQLALTQLSQSLDAVERTAVALDEARAALQAQRADTQQAIAAASAVTNPPATLEAAVASARQSLETARDDDPVAGLELLIPADRELDAQLADAREASERRGAAEAALERTLASARARILSAQEFVTAHRGGVGADARARLAEAQAQLQLAVDGRGTDPVSALESAQRALELAGHALQSAERDVQDALSPGGVVGGLLGGSGVGGGSSSGGSGGALLGGLIGGLLSGGGSSGGFGGGGFGGGWSGGSSRPSFGSSSGRRSSSGGARRGSSGRSSGRRGGGGRF